ncbi:MAG: type VI secretion system contractile sheath large subunit [Pseudomonadota bacterium]
MSTEAEAAGAAAIAESPDEFSDLLQQSFKPRTERAASDVDNAIGILVGEALADTNVVKEDVLDTIEEMIAKLDEKLTEQMNEIMHNKAFQELESSWRGLHHLVMNSETDSTLKIRVMNMGKMELFRTLKSFPGQRWDQSPIFKKMYEQEFGQLGGEPYGALTMDYYFDHSPMDVQLLRDMSKVAGACHAPMFTGVAPSLLGMDDWSEINNPRALDKIFDTPEYSAWKTLRDSEDSRYVGLCMPRTLARVPYGAKSEPVEEFGFEEEVDGHDGGKYAWINAAYSMAVNVNRSFKENGWCTRIRGVTSGGEVENLPTHTFKTDDGGVDMKCPTEVAIPDRREAELAKSGLIPLVHRKNTDKAAFIGAQSLFKPRVFEGPNGVDATAADNLSARLPYMFATCRFSHYLKCMIRDAVGSFKEKPQLEKWLQGWIAQYIDGDPINSTEQVKARKPLADAKVTIAEDEENPGYYYAKFFLRPHYQLEGVDVGMSLVSRMPND